MRYLILHKTNAAWEAGAKPTPEVIQRVGAMVGEMAASGVLRGGEGLGPSSEGARVRLSQGNAQVTQGPIPGAGALPARYTLFRASSVDQAATYAGRFGRAFGDVTVDVRPLNEAWDIGMVPKPEGLTTRRYMAVVNADAASEAGTPLTAAQKSSLEAYAADLTREGAFLGMEHLEPSRKGKRLKKATRVVLDGPFSETKELIGGFVMVEVPSMEDAMGLARKYLDCVDTDEVEVRGLATL